MPINSPINGNLMKQINMKFMLKTMLVAVAMMMQLATLSPSLQAMEFAHLTAKEIKVGENILSYTDTGVGVPIIFVHGWSSHGEYWKNQIAAFSNSHRVISYEWRGMGGSTGGEKEYEFSALEDDLYQFIKKLNLKQKPILVGHSMGGVQVMHFAARYPTVPAAMVSLDAPGKDDLVTGQGMYWLMKASFFLTGFLSDQNAIALQTPVNKFLFYSDDFIEKNAEYITSWEHQFESNSVASLVNALRALTFRDRLDHQVESLPAMFMVGNNDRFISLQQTIDYSLLFPGSTVAVIPHAAHMSSVEQPAFFNQQLKSFLQQLPSQAMLKSQSKLQLNGGQTP